MVPMKEIQFIKNSAMRRQMERTRLDRSLATNSSVHVHYPRNEIGKEEES